MEQQSILFVRSSTGDEDEDPWDDRQLIAAYEEALELAEEELSIERPDLVQNKTNKGNKKVWKLGDLCRCEYSADGLYYEAQITKILGENLCTVRYLGYENEENVPLNGLQSSAGKAARAGQKKRARKELQQPSGGFDGGSAMDIDYSASGVELPKRATKSKEETAWDTSTLPFAPPPPPNVLKPPVDLPIDADEALNAMLLSWYMSGYHTGYYEGLRRARSEN